MTIRWITHGILALILFASVKAQGVALSETPRAVQGVMDLADWDFATKGPVKLEGDFAFIWNQWVPPQEQMDTQATLKVPGPWTAKDYPILGHASYQLRIKVPAHSGLHLMTLMIAPNARIFINGVEQADFGHVADPAHAEVATYPQRYHVYPLPPDARDVLITVHIQNMLQRPPGILQPFLLGTADQLVAFERGTKILDGMILGSLFALILYHGFLFGLRPKDRTPLYFGVCLLACFFYWFIAGYTSPINAFWDISDSDRLTVFFMIFFVVPAFSGYVHLAYPGLFPSRFLKPMWAATALCFLIVAVVPLQAKFLAMSVYFATVFPAAAFLCGRTVWKAHRRGDHGSRLFFAGILVLIASGIHDDMMYRYAFSNFPLIGWGVVSFSLIQSYFISARFSQAFTRAETSEGEVRALNRNLESIIEEKTRDIRSIMDNIPLAVFMFDSQGYRIHRDYSQHSTRMFARSDLSGVNALDLLFDQSQLTSDQKDQARSAVENSLDQDRLNFDVNAHCLPHEIIRKNKGGEESILELSWSPMENAAASVERLLVTLRDVTDLRHLQRKAQEQNDVLEVLAEILNVAPQRFVDFLLDAREIASQCEALLKKAQVNELFLSLHTLKGSARSLPLKRFTDVVHQAEQILAEERGRTLDPIALEKIKTGLDSVHEAIELYSRVAQEMLNRSLSPEPLLAPTRTSKLVDVLSDITACLPILAEDLGKALPRLQMEMPDLYVTTESERLLHHVFTHVLRNAMDHGLENPEERRKQGKEAEGTVQILVTESGDHIQLSVSDDGRGLALNRLRQLGREHGFSDQDLRDDERVAALIFQSGYSTATELSDVSGRGVGMSAIQRFVEQSGGQVHLRLDPQHQGEAFRNFTLEIRLPRELFHRKQTLSGVA